MVKMRITTQRGVPHIMEHTQKHIDKLLAAGLARKDFTIVTAIKRDSYRDTNGHYHSTPRLTIQIKIKNFESASQHAEGLAAQGYYVSRYWVAKGKDVAEPGDVLVISYVTVEVNREGGHVREITGRGEEIQCLEVKRSGTQEAEDV